MEQTFVKECMERLKTFNVSISNGGKEEYIYCKIDFPIRHFAIANAETGRLKFLHKSFDKYLDHMLLKFEQNVWAKLYKILSLVKKMVNHFSQSVDAILEDVSVTETSV